MLWQARKPEGEPDGAQCAMMGGATLMIGKRKKNTLGARLMRDDELSCFMVTVTNT